MINGNACFAYFNKIWGIPRVSGSDCAARMIKPMNSNWYR
jgi:hypothetical protein